MRFGGRYEDWQEAEQAIRDILFLYRELTDYLGIVGDHDTGTFQPWKFVDCSVDDGYGGDEAEKLLHEGAAVALLSEMIDWWTQGSGSNIETYRAAIEQRRFDHLPTARGGRRRPRRGGGHDPLSRCGLRGVRAGVLRHAVTSQARALMSRRHRCSFEAEGAAPAGPLPRTRSQAKAL